MTVTLKQFIVSSKIAMTARMVDRNPHMADGMPGGSTHWLCQLRCGRRQMSVYFSQGPAICKEPTAADVLNCLALDAAGYENARGSFEEWASEYGYDADSRKAEKIYKVVEKQAAKLRRLLYDDKAFETLLFNTECL